MKEDDFRQIAEFIDEGVQLSIEAKSKTGMNLIMLILPDGQLP